MEQQPTVIRVEGIDPDKMLYSGIDTTTEKLPRYSTAEVAKVFFGRSPHWMRWRERNGHFVLDGTAVVPERSDSNIRKYTLGDIELLSHALAKHHAITTRQLMLALRMLQLQGQIYDLL